MGVILDKSIKKFKQSQTLLQDTPKLDNFGDDSDSCNLDKSTLLPSSDARKSKTKRSRKNTHQRTEINEVLKTGEVVREEVTNPATSLDTAEQRSTSVRLNKSLHDNTRNTSAKTVKRKRGTKQSKEGISCVFCFEIFPSHKDLHAHHRSHDLFCKFCGPATSFISKNALLRHINANHAQENPRFKLRKECPTCGMYFRLLKHHKCEVRDKTKPTTCHICNNEFTTQKYLRRHISVSHQGRLPFVCSWCGYKFATKSSLEVHIARHQTNDLKPFKCDLCFEVGYTCKNTLKRHMQEMHLNQVKLVTCQECGQSMKTQYLKKHMRKHQQGRQFKCSYCDKGFFADADKRAHEVIHRDERLFECEVCNQAFRQKASLKCHFRVHTGKFEFLFYVS